MFSCNTVFPALPPLFVPSDIRDDLKRKVSGAWSLVTRFLGAENQKTSESQRVVGTCINRIAHNACDQFGVQGIAAAVAFVGGPAARVPIASILYFMGKALLRILQRATREQQTLRQVISTLLGTIPNIVLMSVMASGSLRRHPVIETLLEHIPLALREQCNIFDRFLRPYLEQWNEWTESGPVVAFKAIFAAWHALFDIHEKTLAPEKAFNRFICMLPSIGNFFLGLREALSPNTPAAEQYARKQIQDLQEMRMQCQRSLVVEEGLLSKQNALANAVIPYGPTSAALSGLETCIRETQKQIDAILEAHDWHVKPSSLSTPEATEQCPIPEETETTDWTDWITERVDLMKAWMADQMQASSSSFLPGVGGAIIPANRGWPPLVTARPVPQRKIVEIGNEKYEVGNESDARKDGLSTITVASSTTVMNRNTPTPPTTSTTPTPQTTSSPTSSPFNATESLLLMKDAYEKIANIIGKQPNLFEVVRDALPKTLHDRLPTFFPDADMDLGDIYVTAYQPLDLPRDENQPAHIVEFNGQFFQVVERQSLLDMLETYLETGKLSLHERPWADLTLGVHKKSATSEREIVQCCLSEATLKEVFWEVRDLSGPILLEKRETYWNTSPKDAIKRALDRDYPGFGYLLPLKLAPAYVRTVPTDPAKIFLTPGRRPSGEGGIARFDFSWSILDLLEMYNKQGTLPAYAQDDIEKITGVYGLRYVTDAYWQLEFDWKYVWLLIPIISAQYPLTLPVTKTPKEALSDLFEQALQQLAQQQHDEGTLTSETLKRFEQLCRPPASLSGVDEADESNEFGESEELGDSGESDEPAEGGTSDASDASDTPEPGVFSLSLLASDTGRSRPLAGVTLITKSPSDLPDSTSGPVLLIVPGMGLQEFSSSAAYAQGMQAYLDDSGKRALLLSHLPEEDRQTMQTAPCLFRVTSENDFREQGYQSIAGFIVAEIREQQKNDFTSATPNTAPDDRLENIAPIDIWHVEREAQLVQKQKREIADKEEAITNALQQAMKDWFAENNASPEDQQAYLEALQNYTRALLRVDDRGLLSMEQYGDKAFIEADTRQKIIDRIKIDHGIELTPEEVDQIIVVLRKLEFVYFEISPPVSGAAVKKTYGEDSTRVVETPKTLVQVALENLPMGPWDGFRVESPYPDVLTHDYIKTLVREHLNIGANYPAFLEEKLLDSREAQSRKEGFCAVEERKVQFEATEERIKGTLTEDQRQWILTAIEATKGGNPTLPNGGPVEVRQLTVEGVPLHGCLMFFPKPETNLIFPDGVIGTWRTPNNGPVVLYLPGAPGEVGSFHVLNDYYRKIWSPFYRASSLSRVGDPLTDSAQLKALFDKPGMRDYCVQQAPFLHRSELQGKLNGTDKDALRVTSPLIGNANFFEQAYEDKVNDLINQVKAMTTSTGEVRIQLAMAVATLLLEMFMSLLPIKAQLPAYILYLLWAKQEEFRALDFSDKTAVVMWLQLNVFTPLMTLTVTNAAAASVAALNPKYALSTTPTGLGLVTTGPYKGLWEKITPRGTRYFVKQGGLTFPVEIDALGNVFLVDTRRPTATYRDRISQVDGHWGITSDWQPKPKRTVISQTHSTQLPTTPIEIPMDGITLNHLSALDGPDRYTIVLSDQVRSVKFSAELNCWRLVGEPHANAPVWRVGKGEWVRISESNRIGLPSTTVTKFEPTDLTPFLAPSRRVTKQIEIPRKINYVWLGESMPEHLVANVKNNAKLSQQWTSTVYVDADSDAIFQQMTQSLTEQGLPHLKVKNLRHEPWFADFLSSKAGKAYTYFREKGIHQNLPAASDFLRWRLIYEKGGLLTDPDNTFMKNMAGVTLKAAKGGSDDLGIVFGELVTHEKTGHQGPNNSIFASHPKNPKLQEFLEIISGNFEEHKGGIVSGRPVFDPKNPSKFWIYQEWIFDKIGPKALTKFAKKQMGSRYDLPKVFQDLLNSGVELPEYQRQLEALVTAQQPFDSQWGNFPVKIGHDNAMQYPHGSSISRSLG